MKYPALLFIFSLLQHVVYADDTQFEKLLKSNAGYRNLVGNITSSTSGSNSESVNKLTTSINDYIKERENPAKKSNAEVVNQFDTDTSSCTSCPGFINLTADITKIVDRLDKGDKVEDANKAVLDSNNLKFLYYTVKSDLGNGKSSCQKYGNTSSINAASKFEGNFKFLTEKIFDLPNINEAQLIPKGSEEIVYFYRGSGAQKNLIIEVHIKKDGKAHLVYYNYTPSSAEIMASKPKGPNAIDMILDATKKTEPTGDNYLHVGVGLQTGSNFLPNNLNLVNAKTTSQLTDDLVLKTKTNISYNEQTTEVALANGKGENWVVVNATNQTQGNKQFVTTVPMSIDIDSASALKLGATIKDEVTLTNADKGTVDNARTISLGLTDHNNQYVNFEVYNRDSDKYSKITVSNQFDTGVIGQIGAKYEDDNTGVRAFSLQQSTNMGDYGKLSTEFGTTGKSTFVGVKHEVAIGDSTTLSLGARVGDSSQTTMMFQFKTKF